MSTEARRTARLGARGVAAGVVLVAVIAGVLLFRNAGGGSEKQVADAEARGYLDRIVAAARARDWTGLCQLNGAVFNCERQLERAGQDALPPDPPTVVESRFHPKQSPDGTDGRILVVEGTDGRGERYRTEVLIFREGDHLEATNAVYWSNAEIYNRERTEQRNRELDRTGKG